MEGYMPSLVAGSEDSDHRLVQPSQSPGRDLVGEGTHVDNDEESSVAGE